MSTIKIQSEYNDLDKYKDKFGYIYYCKKNTNLLHNLYGPAIIHTNGYKEYWVNNKLHRLDGPARIWSDGEERYCINNERLTKEEFEVHPERLKFLGKEYLIYLK